ncbi:hypothetical protein TNCV_162451 [Trichonephila clavipes]|nr:hypothetical protein TNCV_162451 [Trichonephila clavipes]
MQYAVMVRSSAHDHELVTFVASAELQIRVLVLRKVIFSVEEPMFLDNTGTKWLYVVLLRNTVWINDLSKQTFVEEDNFVRAPPSCALLLDYQRGLEHMTATAGSNAVRSGRPIFDDFFQHLWPYIGNNTANVVFQMIKRLWLIRIDQ